MSKSRPLKATPTAELLAVIDRHRAALARDPGNKFCAQAITNITAELEARNGALEADQG